MPVDSARYLCKVMNSDDYYMNENGKVIFTTEYHLAVDGVAVVVVNIVHMNLNIEKETQMLQLQNETDPRIVQPKHLKGKKILIRKGDEILLAKVEVIDNTAYVLWWGAYYPITHFDGWAEIPVVSYL